MGKILGLIMMQSASSANYSSARSRLWKKSNGCYWNSL